MKHNKLGQPVCGFGEHIGSEGRREMRLACLAAVEVGATKVYPTLTVV